MMPAPMKPMFLGVGASEAIVTTERVDLERTGFRTGLERLRWGEGVRATGGAVSAEDREEGTFDDDEALSTPTQTRATHLDSDLDGLGWVRRSSHGTTERWRGPNALLERRIVTDDLGIVYEGVVLRDPARAVSRRPTVGQTTVSRGTRRSVRLGPSLSRVRHTPPVVAMNEIMNHGYVAPPARAATVADLPRESEERPYIVGELTGEFDPFNDFPLPVAARTTPTTPRSAASSTAASRLLEDVGGHEIVGHHIARLRDHEPAAAGVPNYPPPTRTAPAAWQPAPLPRPRTPPTTTTRANGRPPRRPR